MQDAIQSEEVKDLFERITGEKTDKIDFSVFQAIGLDRSVLMQEENLVNMFNSIDQKSKGWFDLEELKTVHETIGTTQFEQVSKEDMAAIFCAGDLNGDGKIDKQEFMQAMYMQNQLTTGFIKQSKEENQV